jgi:threonine dehydrogenase-like Zn-dependent dehydrogenase
MRAIRNTDQGILVADADEPEGPGIRLAIASIGICGTDINFAASGVQGYTYGHEFAGTTVDGQSYAIEPTVYCGECDRGTGGAMISVTSVTSNVFLASPTSPATGCDR